LKKGNPNIKEIGKKTHFKENDERINRTGANRFPLSSILKELTEQNIAEIEIKMTSEDGTVKVKKLKLETKSDFKTAINFILMQKALAGDLKAIEMMFDRIEGKAPQTIDSNVKMDDFMKIFVNSDTAKNEIDKLNEDE
jgi:hypothetical protein